MLLTAWAYTWRVTPLHRGEEDGDPARDGPPPLPPGIRLEQVQLPESGHGPLLRRRYRVDVLDGELDARALIALVREDPNRVVPWGLARFHKENGDGPLEAGDDYTVRMPGPWDGPVRVLEATPCSFRLATLEGHLEAGQIEWRAEDLGDGVRFEVESWSRPGDRWSHLAHHRLRAAKEVQFYMWTGVLERVARLARGRMRAGIDARTWVVP